MIKRIMFVAGEVSGDIHGACLIEELKKLNSHIQVFGLGGKAMESAGMELIDNILDRAVIGVWEAVKNIIPFLKLIARLEQLLDEKKPDLLVLIDYSGLNLRLARLAKQKKIPVVYYFCPQVWAWRKYRAAKVAELVDLVVAVFPFELPIYKKVGASVVFFGHPVIDELVWMGANLRNSNNNLQFNLQNKGQHKGQTVTLMPGSRPQELESLLPVMIETCKILKEKTSALKFNIRVAPHTDLKKLNKLLSKAQNIEINLIEHRQMDIFQNSDLVLVASGSATLETAALGLPMIIVYKVNIFSWILAKLFLKLDNVGLANIISGKNTVPELMQWSVTPENLAAKALAFLSNPERCRITRKKLVDSVYKISSPGIVKKVALSIINFSDQQLSTKEKELDEYFRGQEL
jgi:lipid-A-disaccharide synthase